jgi:hypothetical protein
MERNDTKTAGERETEKEKRRYARCRANAFQTRTGKAMRFEVDFICGPVVRGSLGFARGLLAREESTIMLQ